MFVFNIIRINFNNYNALVQQVNSPGGRLTRSVNSDVIKNTGNLAVGDSFEANGIIDQDGTLADVGVTETLNGGAEQRIWASTGGRIIIRGLTSTSITVELVDVTMTANTDASSAVGTFTLNGTITFPDQGL